MNETLALNLQNDSSIPFKSNKPMEESDHGTNYHKSAKYFIPNIFKENPLKPLNVSGSDKFLTHHSAKEYCSLFATNEDNVPNYLHPFKDFIDNVLDIPDNVFEDIAKVHIEREEKFKELENEEEKKQAQYLALELKEKNTMDKRVKMMLNRHRYYVKRCCPVKIPFKSTLSHEEHEFYIRCFFKFQFRSPVNSLEEKEHEQFMSMQNRVFDEQSCLMNFSYKVSQMVLKNYNEVPEVINDYIEEYVTHRCKRALNYPSYYKSEIEIPLKTQTQEASSEQNFQFTHVGHLLSLGTIPWMIIPDPKFKTSLPKDDDTLLDNKNPNCDDKFDKSTYLYKCPVSEDPNAEYLAKKYNASIVITPSAFKTIVDNQEQPYDKEWNIPVKIKSYKIKDDNGKEKNKRIIYIDKPLVKKAWLPLQKKYTYFKIAAKAVLSNSLHDTPKYYKLRKPNLNLKGQERLISYDDNVFSDVAFDNHAVERFASHSPSEVKPKPNCSNKKRLLSEELERDLFISEDEEESRSSFDQDFNNTSTNKSEGSTVSNTFKVSTSVTTDRTNDSIVNTTATSPCNNITTSTAAFNNTETNISVTAIDQANTINITHSITTSNTCNNSTANDDHSRQASLKAAIPPPLNYKCVKKQANDKSFKKLKTNPNEQRNPQYKTPKKGNYSSDKSEGFLDTLLDTQDSFLKLKKSPSGKGNEAIVPILNTYGMNNPSQNFDKRKPWDNTINKEWDENILIKDCPPQSFDSNVHYQLFQFENTIHGPCKEDVQKPVTILVRHNVHGIVANRKFKKQKYFHQIKDSRAFVVTPKVENQIYFGAEVNSVSEIVQQWADLLLRPNTHLLQIRACTESADVMMTQQKNFESILKDGKQKHINFNPQSVFSMFNILLNTLTRMSSGDYLLHHSPKTGAFMKLMKSHDSKENMYSSSFDLHKMYSETSLISKQYRTSPWLAIDTYVFTPFHMTHHKIPATFPMGNVKKLNRNEKVRRKTKAKNKMSMDGFQ